MDNGVMIRKVKPSDARNWLLLVNKVWRDAYKHIFPEEVFKEKDNSVDRKEKDFSSKIYNNAEKIALVAEADGKIVGIMSGSIKSQYDYFSKDYADLCGIYIDPNYQGKGIGNSFKRLFEEWAKDNGADKYVIGVLEDNLKARKVYESWGGKLSEYTADFYKLDIPYKEVFYIIDL